MEIIAVEEISDEDIAVKAAQEALAAEGVYSLYSGITDTIQENLLRKSIDAPGVKVSRQEDHVSIDVSLVTEYGYNIPSVAWNVQERIKRKVEQFHGLTVDVVDIRVQKIHFSDPDESAGT